MAWSYSRRFQKGQVEIQLAHEYQRKMPSRDFVQYRSPPHTAGAGNGQGRKPKWNAGKTKAIRVPEKFAEQLLSIAHDWDKSF